MLYQPESWGKGHSFLALRYAEKETEDSVKSEQYRLFDSSPYIDRVFVADMDNPLDLAS